MNTPQFQWTHYINQCTQCGECTDTCKALTLTPLKRIIRNSTLCTRCETCSTICDNIVTEFIQKNPK